ncbi:hypothetical protein [Streptomyces sp. NPDC000880]
MTTAVAHAETAAPLAALLPARRGTEWTVGPAEYGIRSNCATSRITNGRHALVVVEEASRIEVFADRPDDFAVTPDAVVDVTSPDPVAALAAHVLRRVLPMLDSEAATQTAHAKGWEQVLSDKAGDLTEIGFHLVDHGAHPEPIQRIDGPGIEWTTGNGAEWGLYAFGTAGNLTLTYQGPASGLYGLLPFLLAPADGHAPTDASSGFARHLSARFPQLRPVDADELEFGNYREPQGWIALPAKDEHTDRADDTTRVAAQVGPIGADLLLTAVPHLI